MENLSDKAIEKFQKLFTGYTKAYGTFDINKLKNDKKRKGTALTVRKKINFEHYKKHLYGEQGIGVVPIKDDNLNIVFCALDIDDYNLPQENLLIRIDESKVPFLTCLSKSGGYHLYLFFVEDTSAQLIQKPLRKIAKFLGYPDCEIFPKQEKRLKPKIGEIEQIGNWINLPYFSGNNSTRTCVQLEKHLELEVFLDHAEKSKVSLSQLIKLSNEIHTDENLDEKTSLKKIAPIPENIKLDLIGKKPFIPEGQRNETIFKECVSLVNNGASDKSIKDAAFQLNQYCTSPLHSRELEQISNSAIKYRNNSNPNSNLSNSLLPLTDLGNGERFARNNKGKAIFCIEQKCWYAYEEGRWSNQTMSIFKLAEKTTKDINTEIAILPDFSDQIKKWAKNSENVTRQKAMLETARHHLDTNFNKFNNNKFLFNLNNGTYDLKRFKIRNHDPKDLITAKTSFNFDPDANCPEWIKFINQVTNQNIDLQKYIQKLCGYCLMGERNEQIIVFIVGPGANGKSVFINTLSHVFGDYAGVINAKALISGNYGSIPSDIAGLYGKRLVTLSEFPEEATLNTTLIKSITGNDKLTARHLYQSWFEFYPEFMLMCAMNQMPEIREDDIAFFRRLKLIEFTKTFSEEEMDKNLPNKLRNESDGIFNWCVEGYQLYKSEGLKDAECIKTSLKYYIERNSPLIEFFKQHIIVTNDESDKISINSMCDYANEFSKSLYGTILEKNTIYKFFKSQGHFPKQKRIRSERIRCYLGLKYISLSDGEVPF